MMLAFREQEGVCGSGGGPAGRERALMLAVLEDAVHCLAGELGPSSERPTLAAEARAWFMTSDPRWPFSFVNICDALGLDADRVRRQLLRDAPEFPPVAGVAKPVLAPRLRRENPPGGGGRPHARQRPPAGGGGGPLGDRLREAPPPRGRPGEPHQGRARGRDPPPGGRRLDLPRSRRTVPAVADPGDAHLRPPRSCITSGGPVRCSGAARPALLRCPPDPRSPPADAGGSPRTLARFARSRLSGRCQAAPG